MKTPKTDRLVALQFLAVVLPVVIVLLLQMLADSRRAAALGASRPLHELAQGARADYKTFMNGVADAVDTGTLSGPAAEALAASAEQLDKLASLGQSALVADAPKEVRALAAALPKGAQLPAILPLRAAIQKGDKATKAIDEELAREDAAVVGDAIASAKRQQFAVGAALLVTLFVTSAFVIATQRRLRRQLEADRLVAEEGLRVRNALDNCSAGMLVADAAGTVVYANRAVYRQLAPVQATLRARRFLQDGERMEGGTLDALVAQPGLAGGLTARLSRDLDIGGRTFRMAVDPVRDATGQRVGFVVEWADRTAEIGLEREVAAVVAAAARGDFSQRIAMTSADGEVGSFNRQLATDINRLLETSEIGLNDIARVLGAFSEGNLTQRIERDYEGTFGKVKDYSNRTAATLEAMIGKIKSASDAIASAAREIARGNQHLSERTEQQAAGLEETVSSVAEIAGVARRNSEGARAATDHAGGALTVARQGGELVERLVQTMTGITAASSKINDIIGVIDGIAFQTNILALNAAVEAARAGEQGRGFSVVASEVRTLAQRSASAAKEISALIGNSVEQVRVGSNLVNTAGETMADIVGSVERVSTIIGEISTASIAQTQSIEHIKAAISEIDDTTQQNAALVEEASAAAASLDDQAAVLVTSVSAFTLSGGVAPPARRRSHAA